MKKKVQIKSESTENVEKSNLLKKHNIIIIVIVALVIFMPYLSDEIIYGDDYYAHLSNLYAIDIDISISDNVFFPSKIRPVMACNFGYGNGIFYSQLSYYCTTVINLIIKQVGFSLIDSVKIFEFIVLVLAGFFIYKFMDTVFKNSYVSLATMIMYMTSPYFMYDIFVRMAYTEIGIFVFMPIVALSIYYILNEDYKKFFIYFIIGYVGMILSHLVMTVYFTILLVFVLLYNWKLVFKKKNIINFIVATILVLTITSPFTISMIEHKINGNYVVFQENSMASIGKLQKHALGLDDIISCFTDAGGAKYINLIVLILLFFTLLNKNKVIKNKNDDRVFKSIMIITLISVLISSKLINWSYVPKMLWNIQFPWRMCTFIAFGSSIIAGISLRTFDNEDCKKIMLILISVVCLYNATKVVHMDELKKVTDITYEEASMTTNGAMGWQKEYLPVNAIENIEYLETRNNGIIIKQGDANIDVVKDKTPYLEFEIKNNDNLVIELPRLFYLGYNIKLINEDGVKQKIEYYENENGFIECKIQSNGKVIVDYSGTFLNKIANIVSIISIIIFLVVCIKNKKNKEEVIYDNLSKNISK